MKNKFRLTRESSEDIGFVKSCFIKGAITNKEFNEKWVPIPDNQNPSLPQIIKAK